MDAAFGSEAGLLQDPDGFQVAHSDAFHVLCATCHNVSIVTDGGRKGIAFPIGFGNRDYVVVRAQND